MRGRPGIAYVVEVNGAEVLLNMHESHRGQVAAHSDGVTVVGQPGDLIAVDAGADLLVLRIHAIAFAEPKEAHAQGVGTHSLNAEPLRQLKARVIGYIRRQEGGLEFTAEEWRLPALCAEAFPLSNEEIRATTRLPGETAPLQLGWDARNSVVPITVDINRLLSRHLAVLGATGYGKTHFVSAVVQELIKRTGARIVVFDINGEYAPAFAGLEGVNTARTIIGKTPPAGEEEPGTSYFRIPYYALGRHGLGRLLLPSGKTQLPALRFAIEHLGFVEGNAEGAWLVGGAGPVLFDDCRPGNAADAWAAMEQIRGNAAPPAATWPHMRALSCLAADWYSLTQDRFGNPERNALLYGHVQSLVNRIRGLIEDDRLQDVVDIGGGAPSAAGMLDWRVESGDLVRRIFGGPGAEGADWQVHIVDLGKLAQDHMPFVLGALLENYADELFRRGQKGSYPTLLVLEEAHHYLRQLPGDEETGRHALAYERLAKEGRKFKLSMMVSTQRPAELSATVLSQCGTWCVFRLTNEQDQRMVSAASEWGSERLLRQISGLPRGQAIAFGASLPMPVRMSVIRPIEGHSPESQDADFVGVWDQPAVEEQQAGAVAMEEQIGG